MLSLDTLGYVFIFILDHYPLHWRSTFPSLTFLLIVRISGYNPPSIFSSALHVAAHIAQVIVPIPFLTKQSKNLQNMSGEDWKLVYMHVYHVILFPMYFNFCCVYAVVAICHPDRRDRHAQVILLPIIFTGIPGSSIDGYQSMSIFS